MNVRLTLSDRIEAFGALGLLLSSLGPEEKYELFRRANNQNSWFSENSMDSAVQGLARLLEAEKLITWLSAYQFPEIDQPKKVGILMAGNIPGVGFHDLMCVLISGNIAVAKLSSADSYFSSWLIQKLIDIEPRLQNYIQIEEMLKGMDAYIATGSDNSARYFNYYFGKYPSIIRSNRTSVAVLTGEESEETLESLGKDIFLYFGLGCRNVSKIFVKNEHQLQHFLDVMERFKDVALNHKYLNNYEYIKSIYLVNSEPHLDNGFLILRESKELVSPIGVLFYELYDTKEDLLKLLESQDAKIQCMVGDPKELAGATQFGEAQYPQPWDYADKVDTIHFLLGLAG
jgi:hypothetical protein